MILGAKRFAHSGRDRYGASLFIDEKTEDIVDTIHGYSRDSLIPVFGLLLIVLKFITSNFIGFAIMSFIFYISYFSADRKLTLHFTTRRNLSKVP